MTLTKTEPTTAHQPATPLHTEKYHRAEQEELQSRHRYRISTQLCGAFQCAMVWPVDVQRLAQSL